jgi:hypothetical protein
VISEKKSAPLWAWVVGVTGLIVFVVALIAGNSPNDKQQARDAIAACWEQQAKKSLEPSVARFVASTCERMQDEFRQKYGHAP